MLVALAVIFLPMLVQGPAPDSGVADVSTRVPDAPASGYETRELPLLGPAAEPGAPVLAAGTDAAEPEEEAAAAPDPADPAVAAGRWAVSFGAYASEKDADAVISRLRQAGLEGFSEQTTVNGRQAWRVRVGPFADRSLAEAGRLRAVRIRNDVNAQVIALDATAEDAAATAATPAPEPAVAAATTAATPAPAPAPAPAPTVATSGTERPAATTPPPAPAKTVATAPAPKPAAPSAAGTAPAQVPAPSPTPAAQGVGFAVQMGAFSKEADATALRDRLRASGFSAIVQPVRTDKGTLHRVRVGPVASRAEAEQLQGRLAAHGGGMVVPHP
ncbi:Sporulation domain-containing protein [Pseudoxanthomonas suwonensis 11-1]|uniref:Sporulation domain-containing protein n=1 Tax=Pseudoxanthomonas suwonensis (strain 11-1) TaxID=743721 RepID=E6WV95_PSEUU|nr:Sporulation domain-containing protein [Pseudoxanthomonas suwonensis 11-1]